MAKYVYLVIDDLSIMHSTGSLLIEAAARLFLHQFLHIAPMLCALTCQVTLQAVDMSFYGHCFCFGKDDSIISLKRSSTFRIVFYFYPTISHTFQSLPVSTQYSQIFRESVCQALKIFFFR